MKQDEIQKAADKYRVENPFNTGTSGIDLSYLRKADFLAGFEYRDAEVNALSLANEGLIEAIVKVRNDFKCGVAEHEVWAINILTETLNKFAKGNL